jgi:hypothetical protein
MALTRKMLKAMELDDDKITQIIDAHQSTIDEIADERDKYKADVDKYKAEAERLGTVEKDLLKAQAKLEDADKVSEKLKNLQNEFAEYRADVDAKATQASKEKAYKDLLKQAGVSDKRFDSIIKVSDLSKIELDKDGKVKDPKAVVDAIKSEWSDFIVTEHEKGAQTPNPPANNGGVKMSKDEIMKIKDTAERQQAMLENKELFLN